MDKLRAENLIRRYSQSSSSKTGAKEMDVAGRGGRDGAMRASGKPKNIRKTVGRMLKYLSAEKTLLIIALICSVLQTLATLAASYMLRPIMNKFLYYDPLQADIADRLVGLACLHSGFSSALCLPFLSVRSGLCVTICIQSFRPYPYVILIRTLPAIL